MSHTELKWRKILSINFTEKSSKKSGRLLFIKTHLRLYIDIILISIHGLFFTILAECLSVWRRKNDFLVQNTLQKLHFLCGSGKIRKFLKIFFAFFGIFHNFPILLNNRWLIKNMLWCCEHTKYYHTISKNTYKLPWKRYTFWHFKMRHPVVLPIRLWGQITYEL